MEDPGKGESFLVKLKNFFTGDRYEEARYEEPEYEDFPSAKRRWSLRLYARKETPIYRKEVSNFDNEVEEPAYRLRQGFVVIVNLEKASEEAARRTIDFLSGVAFGIGGSYEKIGEKVFLFAPPGYSIY